MLKRHRGWFHIEIMIAIRGCKGEVRHVRCAGALLSQESAKKTEIATLLNTFERKMKNIGEKQAKIGCFLAANTTIVANEQ